MISFKVEGSPVSKGRPRFARKGKFISTYIDKSTKDAETNFRAQAAVYKPQTPISGAIKLTLIFASIKPKSKPKKVKHWITRPDLDNYIKLVEDAMNKIFWIDDSQIVEIQATKIYSDNCYTEVKIEELGVVI